MNIVIIGAGGVGSYFGAKLIEAGHDVVLEQWFTCKPFHPSVF